MASIRTGLDRVLKEWPSDLSGRPIGLLTNLTGVDQDLRPGLFAMRRVPGANLVRLFAPEHGVYGDVPAGAPIDDRTDPRTGLPVVSLYGPGRLATPDMLEGLAAVLVDLQDIGCRYYTNVGTALELVDAAHRAGVRVVVLDRPNPLGGAYEGSRTVEEGYASLVGAAPVPMRHGMTLGEVVTLAARAKGQGDAVTVVPVEGWRRSLTWRDLDRPWLLSSPNTNGWEMARAYPGTCLWEGTNMSEGRGTALPFQQVGAPWIDGWAVADAVSPLLGDGVWVRPCLFQPTASKHRGAVCAGVTVHLDPRRDVPVLPVSLHVLSAMMRSPQSAFLPEDPSAGRPREIDRLAGSDALRRDLTGGRPVEDILDAWRKDLADWPEVRRSVSLYPD